MSRAKSEKRRVVVPYLLVQACIAGHYIPIARAVPLWGAISASGFCENAYHKTKKLKKEEWMSFLQAGKLHFREKSEAAHVSSKQFVCLPARLRTYPPAHLSTRPFVQEAPNANTRMPILCRAQKRKNAAAPLRKYLESSEAAHV